MKKNMAALLGAVSVTVAFTACSQREELKVQLRRFDVEGPVVTAQSCDGTIWKDSRRFEFGPYCSGEHKISYDFGSNSRCYLDETPVRADGAYGEYRIESRKMNCQKFSELTQVGQQEVEKARFWLNKAGTHYEVINETPAP